MYTLQDAEDACATCGGDGAVNMSGVNLCLFHFAQEYGLDAGAAKSLLRSLEITSTYYRVVPSSELTGLGKTNNPAELGM